MKQKNCVCQQCDQMTVLFYQYLGILINENVPNRIKFASKWVENFAQTKLTLIILPKIFNCLPKCWNFAKSGPTVCQTKKIQ